MGQTEIEKTSVFEIWLNFDRENYCQVSAVGDSSNIFHKWEFFFDFLENFSCEKCQ